MAIKKGIPDPGHYPMVDTINKLGKYVSSETKNSLCVRWSKDDRLKYLSKIDGAKSNFPGPGEHEAKGNVADLNGSYLSHFHSLTEQRGFGTKTAVRISSTHQSPRFNTPGPGHYRPPSDFGYVDFRQDKVNEAKVSKMGSTIESIKEVVKSKSVEK
jgi:hypothetical protein